MILPRWAEPEILKADRVFLKTVVSMIMFLVNTIFYATPFNRIGDWLAESTTVVYDDREWIIKWDDPKNGWSKWPRFGVMVSGEDYYPFGILGGMVHWYIPYFGYTEDSLNVYSRIKTPLDFGLGDMPVRIQYRRHHSTLLTHMIVEHLV